MSTAHKTAAEIQEHFDTPAAFQAKADEVVRLIRAARHLTVFTGAGISTAAGISDFRGPTGVWTRRAAGKAPVAGTSTLAAVPTAAHMAIVELVRRGIVKHVISQNTDGLHRRSGVPTGALSELHGNSNLERCAKCGREYMRDFRCRRAQHVHEHETGRICTVPKCGGKLQDTIINFGENLPTKPLQDGEYESSRSDVMLSLGSSLRVTPAADMPAEVARHGKLVICNLQLTPLDKRALVVHSKIDELMIEVMRQLGIPIPEFRLHRFVEFERTASGHAVLRACDSDETPLSLFKQVTVLVDDREFAQFTAEQEPFSMPLKALAGHKVTLHCVFRGHYNEPAFHIDLNVPSTPGRDRFHLSLGLRDTDWLVKPWTGKGDASSQFVVSNADLSTADAVRAAQSAIASPAPLADAAAAAAASVASALPDMDLLTRKLVDMGFSADEAMDELAANDDDVHRALAALLRKHGQSS